MTTQEEYLDAYFDLMDELVEESKATGVPLVELMKARPDEFVFIK
jgi:hypothetical protein